MRFWFAPHSDVPLYRQLATQVQLAILSGDLRAGDRLPSTREMARRFAIHANTVSAGYRELEREGWTELRPAAVSMFATVVRRLALMPRSIRTSRSSFATRTILVCLLPRCVRGWRKWIAVPAPDHWLLVDSDDEARQILLTELRAVTTRNVHESSLADCCDAERIKGAIVCCRPTQEQRVRAAVPAGVEVVALPITSANQWLLPWLPAPKGLLIAVVSHWPEFLEKARAMLAAAGVSAEALIFCDARKPGWQRGLDNASGILCDAFTASVAKLPKGPQVVVFPLLAMSAREVLEQAWL